VKPVAVRFSIRVGRTSSRTRFGDRDRARDVARVRLGFDDVGPRLALRWEQLGRRAGGDAPPIDEDRGASVRPARVHRDRRDRERQVAPARLRRRDGDPRIPYAYVE
jgi:hypothetical protein